MVEIICKWVFILSVYSWPVHHPYHVSVTEIEYIPQEKEAGISCKLFTDDFESILRETYNTKIDLFNPVDKNVTGKQIAGYINKHLRLKIDGKLTSPVFIGFEREGEATWCYFSVSNINEIKKIEVVNDLLYDFKKEQVNLIHITVNGIRKSTRLAYPDVVAVFEF